MSKRIIQSVLSVSVLASMMSMAFAAQNEQEQAEQTLEKPAEPVKLETIFVTAEEQVKQSLGVSVITKEDLEKLPVRNDISDYVRRMPGVNLTGNSATGQRGNNRQIDIRGMGPENTLILVDGKPINSRNSVVMAGKESVIHEATQTGYQQKPSSRSKFYADQQLLDMVLVRQVGWLTSLLKK